MDKKNYWLTPLATIPILIILLFAAMHIPWSNDYPVKALKQETPLSAVDHSFDGEV